MPPRKRQQSSAMLVALVVFVILFIGATIAGVAYYVKAEDYRTSEATLRSEVDDLASSAERQRLGSIVGAREAKSTWLGTMLENLDRSVTLVLGGVAQETSAEVKLNDAVAQVQKAVELAREHVQLVPAEPNSVGLVRVIRELKSEVDRTKQEVLALQAQLVQLRNRYDDALATSVSKEKLLEEEKAKLEQQVNEITADYDQLKVLLEQTADARAQVLMTQLDDERTNVASLNQELLRTQAELKLAQDMLKESQSTVAQIKPPPDSNVPAYQPDGRIILIDDAAQVVHISIGQDDHIYRGLTFTVYDRGKSVSKDGKGKAEIEVFDVQKNYSAARIISSNIRSPILVDDVIANVIWDRDEAHVFVISGDFDIDGDGTVDVGAAERIKGLIERWGGKAAESITVDTDFLILGHQPRVFSRPTLEDLEKRGRSDADGSGGDGPVSLLRVQHIGASVHDVVEDVRGGCGQAEADETAERAAYRHDGLIGGSYELLSEDKRCKYEHVLGPVDRSHGLQ